MEDWKCKAKYLYFEKHEPIIEVARLVGRTRQTVAAYLRTLPWWEDEQEYRKNESQKRRKRAKRIWDQLNRVTNADVQRDHFTAVAELSAEKYH